MDMPEPMNSSSYDHTSNEIKEAAKVVAERSMSDVAKDLRGDNESADIAVSVDGSWQKKGIHVNIGCRNGNFCGQRQRARCFHHVEIM